MGSSSKRTRPLRVPIELDLCFEEEHATNSLGTKAFSRLNLVSRTNMSIIFYAVCTRC